jgi:excisionase family DNA binding protein
MTDSPHPRSGPIPGLEPVLTTSELAAHLGVRVQTIHDLRHSGRGPRGIRVGRELRYRLSEVNAWLSKLEQGDQADRGSASTDDGRER